MQDLAPLVLDHEEAVQELESQRWQGKEIKSDAHFSMIGEERQPAFGWIAATWPHASEISGDRPFGDFEAEFPRFPVDLRRSPVGVFFTYLRPAAAEPRSPAPVQAKARPMAQPAAVTLQKSSRAPFVCEGVYFFGALLARVLKLISTTAFLSNCTSGPRATTVENTDHARP